MAEALTLFDTAKPLAAPNVTCGVMLLSLYPYVSSRRNSTPALNACLPAVKLKVSPYCRSGLLDVRVEPNPADQFMNEFDPIKVVTGWNGIPLFCGNNLNACTPVPVGDPEPSIFLPK